MAYNYGSNAKQKTRPQAAARGGKAQHVSKKKEEVSEDRVMPVANLAVSIPDAEGLIYLTGLFENKSKSGMEYLGGRTNEDVTIPAGSYISVFFKSEDEAQQ